jgi:archaellum biogenesis ATPase FlaH
LTEDDVYAFSSKFISKLVALILVDPYGPRLVDALEADSMPSAGARLLFAVLKCCDHGEYSTTVLSQLMYQRYKDGAIKREAMEDGQRLLRQAQRQRPVSREDAQRIVSSEIMNVGLGVSLEEAFRLYRKREFAEVKSIIEEPYEHVRLLESGNFGMTFPDDWDEYERRVRDGTSNVERIPFGLAPFDERIGGGLGVGELGAVIAAQKAGKSMALVHVAQTGLCLGKTVIYISLELAQDVVSHRIWAGLLDVESTGLAIGGIDTWRQLRLRREELAERVVLGRLHVKQFPGNSVTVRDIEAYIRDVKRNKGLDPDIIIVDYADEVAQSAAYSQSNYLGIGDIYTQLRALGAPENSAYGTSCGFSANVWTASQVKGAAADKELLTMHDAAESYLKAAKVDLMVALCQDDAERESSLVRFYNAVCRFAPGGRGTADEYGPFAMDYTRGRLFKPQEYDRFSEETLWQVMQRAQERNLQGKQRSSRKSPLPRPQVLEMSLLRPLLM